MKLRITIFLFAISIQLNAQTTAMPSKATLPQPYQKHKLEVAHNFLALRFGVGVSSSFMMELGLSKGHMKGYNDGGIVFDYYSSVQYVPRSKKGDAIYGILVGGDFVNMARGATC